MATPNPDIKDFALGASVALGAGYVKEFRDPEFDHGDILINFGGVIAAGVSIPFD